MLRLQALEASQVEETFDYDAEYEKEEQAAEEEEQDVNEQFFEVAEELGYGTLRNL